MPKQVKKSRVFAVVLAMGGQLGAYFLCKRTETEEGKEPSTFLDTQAHQTPWPADHHDALVQLLAKAGLTVRFYDSEEKQWMDLSTAYGSVRAPGSRDGTWGPPRSVEEFEESYLKTV